MTVAVPGGTFLMGSATGRPDESPPHRVTVRAFRLGRTPVTHAQYARFVEEGLAPEPALVARPGLRRSRPAGGRRDVVRGRRLCAVARGQARWLWRLPSEAEWERAARGGLAGARTAWGDALPPGEIPDGPLAGPWPAGRGRPNGYGLLDMGTIVHEWCLDWYGPEEGVRRASRGGSWRHHVRWSPPSARSSLPPGLRYADYGFRVLEEIG